MENGVKSEQEAKNSLGRLRAPKGSHSPTDGLRAPSQLFDSTILPAFRYAAETWPDTWLQYNECTQHLDGLRSLHMKSISSSRSSGIVSKAKHRDWSCKEKDRRQMDTLEWIPRGSKRSSREAKRVTSDGSGPRDVGAAEYQHRCH
ncbi:unnamed protein product [Strongylus vulgaris]|uniref:Uncharacterized protein n=1 Tax=Strongylus vulgaris TaxID=40348 RepID=A0A3P7IRS9_STRVU|nr:unnamed protein product [Strongylus vulgaris]